METKKVPFWFRLIIPSIFDILVILVIAIMFMAHHTLKDYDIWWHLRTGQILLAGIFPKVDIFSYTALGKEWILHEWGSEIIFFALFKKFGVAGLLLLRALIAGFVIGIVYKTMLRRKVDIFIALKLALVTLFSTSIVWGERPHLFTVLFLVILVYFYNEYKYYSRNTLLYIMPPMFLAWVNLHGGYVIGFIFLAVCIFAHLAGWLFKLDEDSMPIKKTLILMGVSALSFVVCFINPNTYRGVLYPLLYLGDKMPDFHKIIEEWFAASWTNNKEFILVFFFLTSMIAISRIRPKLEQILLFLVFAYFAFSAQRHVPLFSLIMIPMFAPQVQDNIERGYLQFKSAVPLKYARYSTIIGDYFTSRSRMFAGLETRLNIHGSFMILLILFSVFILSGHADQQLRIGMDQQNFPFEMASYLKDKPLNGNVFNDYGWGGFMLWQLPERRVFIDGRLDVYRKGVTDEYFKVVKLQDGWTDVITKYDIKYILIGKDQIASRFLTRVSPQWRLEKQTANAMLFSRK